MKHSIVAKLAQLSRRLEELTHLLSSETATADLDNYRKLTREHAEIAPVVELYQAYRSGEDDVRTAQEMAGDPAMRDFAESEIRETRQRLEKLEAELQTRLLPRDPNDERNIFVEIRAGTGGDESALFAGELFRMYARFAERNGWHVELISQSPAEIGGYKEIIVKIVGRGAYSKLKFESGGHRVQRVPVTETQGRIHTSACTVAVMPEADEIAAVVLNPSELRIDTFRASGAGGQHVNKTESAVRITHLPTQIVVQSQAERSQHRNREFATRILRTRLFLHLQEQERLKTQAITAPKKDIDFGSQIRSYVIHPYTMVNDHRTELKVGDVHAVLDGDLDAFTDAYLKRKDLR